MRLWTYSGAMDRDEARTWISRGVDEDWPDEVFVEIARQHGDLFWTNPHHMFLREAIGRLAPGSDVLELGCSTGALCALAAEAGAASVTGLDIDAKRLHKARLRLAEHDVSHVFMECDLQKRWPLDAESQDLIVCSEVIEHLRKGGYTEFLGEAHRVLRAGGRLVLTTPNGERWLARGEVVEEAEWSPDTHSHELSRPELADLLTKAGFERVDVEFYRYPKVHRYLRLRGHERVADIVEKIPPRRRLSMNLAAFAEKL